MEVKKGTVDRSETFHLRNSSDGTSKTGLLYNSTGAVASYRRTGGLSIEIPLKALSTPAPDDAHDDGGFIEINSTLSKGDYRIDVPDAAYASGVDEVIIHLGFTGVFEESLRVTLKDKTEKDILEAVLTRLASKEYGTDICPSAVTVVEGTGTIVSGDVTDCCTINQRYLKVQETGSFKIDFEFTGLSAIEDSINVIYRYFGPGSTNHKVECLMWNYQTSAWDDMLATDRDFPSSEEDKLVHIQILGTVSDYFTGTLPNISAKVRIDHVSNYITDHYFWVEYITLGELERIYVPADNVGITAIDEAVQVLVDTHVLVGSRATTIQLYETGGTTPIADADVSVFNDDLSLYMGRRKTDANGQFTIGRDDGTYKLVPQKAGWTFNPPLTLTVVDHATHTYYGDTILIPQPGDAEECILYVDLVSIENEYSEGVVFTVTLKTAPKAVGGKLIDPTIREYKTDANGHKEITLVKGCKYRVDSKALPQGIDIDTTDQTSINIALQI